MSAPNDIILFHYPFSPYARRITWYFTLRGIEYAQCLQSPVLPRPDLEALNVSYRRIPVLSIGRDIYCDTRLILRKSAGASKPVTLKGPEAIKLINNAEFAEPAGRVDENDPLGLKSGAQVQVWPIDSGFSHKDQGQLVTLVPDEVTIAKETKEGKEIRIHAPRWGFRIVEATGGSSRL